MIEATSRGRKDAGRLNWGLGLGGCRGRRGGLGGGLAAGCVAVLLALAGPGAAQQPKLPAPPGDGKPGPEKVPGLPEVEIPPAPQPFPGFSPRAVRLPRLPGAPAPLGSTPMPSPKDIAEYNRFIEKFVDPRNTLDLIVNRHRLMFLKQEPKRIQIGDEKVASYNLIKPTEIIIVGRQVGTTVLNLWFEDPDKKGKEVILSYLVRVLPDPEAKERLERAYQALADEINDTFPDSFVKMRMVGDKLIVSGQARDIAEGTHILQIIRANAPPTEQTRIPVSSINLNVTPGDLSAPGGVPGLESFLMAGGPNVVNLMRIPGEQQVMLKVTVAEVNRQAARTIGLDFSIRNNQGITVFSNNTGTLANGAGFNSNAGGAAGGGNGTGGVNLPINLDNGQISLSLHALKHLNYARALAEPNLVVMNGQTGSFLAGGQFPVPVITGFTAAGLQGVQFVPYGVQLAFTPYITDKDRIRLTVQSTVSVRDPGSGTSIGGGNIAGLNTRNFTTTVELREGQTLAVAGLIQQNLGTDSQRLPFLGNIPFLGQLTGVTRHSAGEQELVVLITPELVHPMEPKQIPPLPGSDLFEPSDLEFYVLGRMESRRAYDYRSPVMTDIHRMIRYHKCEQTYMFGPSGHEEPR
ncbi:MAG: pilus assembly protein N-terminal domain-containing protein [Gemmataceae bacterium]|nr:pilus assembly protein N-terminal domain-containing protein [Gemmataceae bacterium]